MPRDCHNPIIVALDVESAARARALVARIGPRVNFYKVGLELYTAAGREIVKQLLGEGKQVFLDLKMYDIPETVARAVSQVALTGVRFLTVHAVMSVMRAAVAARAGSRLQILGVTMTVFGPTMHRTAAASRGDATIPSTPISTALRARRSTRLATVPS